MNNRISADIGCTILVCPKKHEILILPPESLGPTKCSVCKRSLFFAKIEKEGESVDVEKLVRNKPALSE